ncbi:MAG: DUF5820 family protein [Haloarculaceae archaeon]
MTVGELPDGWTVWSEADARFVLAYRPDVFDAEAFPAPCLPTIYGSKGRRGRRPGPHDPADDDPWYVTLSLEPEVARETDVFDSRAAAVGGARDLAASFAAGDVDYHDLYQVPRPEYLDKLDELTGRA